MAARMSLAEQLASIRDDAPVEFDPEAVDYGASTSAARDLDAGRADYVEVGTSQLRKNLDTEAGPQYAGTKSSRKELFGYQSGSEDDEDIPSDDEDDEDDEDMKEDEDEDEDIEEEEGEEVLPFGQGSESGSGEDEESTSDGEGGLSSSKVKPKNRASKSNGTNGHNSHLDKDSRDMLQELKKASTADMEKGRDVRKQLSFWDTLLEARIRLQKCVTSAHVLPDPSQANAYEGQAKAQLEQSKNSLEELSELLFSIRSQLHERNDKILLSQATSKKRKRGSPEYLDNALEAVTDVSNMLLPHEQTTISKWSDKVSSATAALGSQNKFKALGPQNTLRQIESILSQDMDRLVERSRIRRAGTGGKAIKVVGRDGAHEPVAGEKDVSAEVFDDTDFYQALLRDVVDIGHSGGAGTGGPGSYANFNNTSKKKAAGVDPKASKGRKLRFHVHEKLQNFMAPVPTISWEKEQIDELFRGLLGGRTGVIDESAVENISTDAAGVSGEDVGSFRIF